MRYLILRSSITRNARQFAKENSYFEPGTEKLGRQVR